MSVKFFEPIGRAWWSCRGRYDKRLAAPISVATAVMAFVCGIKKLQLNFGLTRVHSNTGKRLGVPSHTARWRKGHFQSMTCNEVRFGPALLLSHEFRNTFARSDMRNRGLDRHPYHRNKPPKLPEWQETLWRMGRGCLTASWSDEGRPDACTTKIILLAVAFDTSPKASEGAKLILARSASEGAKPFPGLRFGLV